MDMGKLKVTAETAAWLDFMHRKTGRNRLEIVRNALHEIATEQLDDASVLDAFAVTRGIRRDSRGRPHK